MESEIKEKDKIINKYAKIKKWNKKIIPKTVRRKYQVQGKINTTTRARSTGIRSTNERIRNVQKTKTL